MLYNTSTGEKAITGRTIIIGDVHGCYAELLMLLDRLSPTASDKVLFLGDLVNRGPDSRRVVEIARDLGAQSLMGNHELRLLRFLEDQDTSRLKSYDYETINALGEAEWAYLKEMALWEQMAEYNTVCVHGGFLLNIPWHKQDADVVTRIQVIENGRALKRSDAPRAPHWSRLWKGPPYVVYGHTPRMHVDHQPWALGIDTSCVYGGALTAYVLPAKELVQVKARYAYVSKG